MSVRLTNDRTALTVWTLLKDELPVYAELQPEPMCLRNYCSIHNPNYLNAVCIMGRLSTEPAHHPLAQTIGCIGHNVSKDSFLGLTILFDRTDISNLVHRILPYAMQLLKPPS